MANNTTESQSYNEMLSNVEGIIQQISQPGQDLDHVINQVEKGYELIKAMRERLDTSKKKIETLLAENSADA